MSLTSYRAAPPRGGGGYWVVAIPGGLGGIGLGDPRGSGFEGREEDGMRRLVCGRVSRLPPGFLAGWLRAGRGDGQGAMPVGPLAGWRAGLVLCRPGDDLLSQVLRHSTIGAEEFNGRVRDGIGFRLLARATRPAKDKDERGGTGLGGPLARWSAQTQRFVARVRAVSAGLSFARRDKPFGLRGEHWQ